MKPGVAFLRITHDPVSTMPSKSLPKYSLTEDDIAKQNSWEERCVSWDQQLALTLSLAATLGFRPQAMQAFPSPSHTPTYPLSNNGPGQGGAQ